MLFDLDEDIGEYRNVARSRPIKHDMLFREMITYLDKVGARLPKNNPNFNPAAYQQVKEYDMRLMWGPFGGERPLEDDER